MRRGPSIRAIAARVVLVGLVVTCATSAAYAGGQRAKLRAAAEPPKDCTKLNGRSGYYGNPWCTPAEQDRWDRWDARRR